MLLVIAVPTIAVVFRTQAAPPRGALEVVVRGRQWWWEFYYPAYQLTTANELHLPAGRPATLVLEGPDVIPGRVNRLPFTPETPGEYRLRPADDDRGGDDHGRRRGTVSIRTECRDTDTA